MERRKAEEGRGGQDDKVVENVEEGRLELGVNVSGCLCAVVLLLLIEVGPPLPQENTQTHPQREKGGPQICSQDTLTHADHSNIKTPKH